MSDDESAKPAERTRAEETRARIQALESHVSPASAPVTDRLTLVRSRLEEYELAESEEEERTALEKVETELDQLREAIERELDQGKAKAHDLVDDVEKKLSDLRH
ncbi:MAG: hypothetical protein ABEJ85_02995 [Haloarculaceae archaeon]